MELPDRTAEYRQRDLQAEGIWVHASKPRYGGVVFNDGGEVLLREPLNHFTGYVWTFPKGAGDSGEDPAGTALREVFEETGCAPRIVGHLTEGFVGGVAGSTNFYYVMATDKDELDSEAVTRDHETESVRWASYDEARHLVSETTNPGGQARDLKTLDAAFEEYNRIVGVANAAP